MQIFALTGPRPCQTRTLALSRRTSASAIQSSSPITSIAIALAGAAKVSTTHMPFHVRQTMPDNDGTTRLSTFRILGAAQRSLTCALCCEQGHAQMLHPPQDTAARYNSRGDPQPASYYSNTHSFIPLNNHPTRPQIDNHLAL